MYKHAERFLPQNLRKKAFGLTIIPNWIGNSDCFWYVKESSDGKTFMYVNPNIGTIKEAFDHEKLAAAISASTEHACTSNDLPFSSFDFVNEQQEIVFTIDDKSFKCDLNTYSIESWELKREINRDSVVSPDGKWAAFVKDYNLYVRSLESGEEIRLTNDGEEKYHYGCSLNGPLDNSGIRTPNKAPAVLWSPDSQKLLSYRVDHRNAPLLHWVQSVPLDGSKRPLLHSCVYPLPGDSDDVLPRLEPYLFDLGTHQGTRVEMDPILLFYYEGPYFWAYWTKDERIIIVKPERGFMSLTLCEIDAKIGKGRVITEFPESVFPWSWGGEPFIAEMNQPEGFYRRRPSQFARWVVDDGNELLWISEQDGWAHLYLYDGRTGEKKRQITSGSWVVREIRYVDEENRVVYFTAAGKETGRDPYYRHLYRVNMDGSGLELLTPEDAEHEIRFSPTGQYFIDSYSRVDLPPVAVLRSNDGRLITKLQEADIAELSAMGWRFPERFKAKARDGITDIYGVIYRPSHFSPDKLYPIIEGNYSGPQTIRTPKSFLAGTFSQDQALAELGFIVVTIDGLGSAYRSKAFSDFSFKNLGDGGFPDHITAFKQLADRYPYMDLSRVGIYGASAGGYGAARAILAHPDFYQVSVAWAGNYDHRTDKSSWNERYMGIEVGEHYEEQSCCHLARNLKGRLLMMHGDMDENVHPSSLIQLVDALIKANKDFDMLIIPNATHGHGNSPYVVRKRWDYFVEHLLGLEPPKEYEFGKD